MPISVGIDLGGHNIKAGLVEDGVILRKIEEKTVSRHHRPVIEQIGRLAKQLGANSSIPVGVGIPGGLDATRENALMITNFIDWNGLPLRAMIEEASGAPTKIENDANAYALGEGCKGAAEGLSDYVVITLGTGLGGGIIIGGKILSGSHGLAGELGHMVIGNDEKCGSGCGGKGHIESFCTADALERLSVEKKLCANGEIPDMKKLWEKRNQKNIADFWDTVLNSLAKGVATIMHVIDPQAIIFGGGLSQGEGFIDSLRPKIMPYLGIPYRELLDLRLSIHGNDAAIIGAAVCAVK
jgi:glucokinase